LKGRGFRALNFLLAPFPYKLVYCGHTTPPIESLAVEYKQREKNLSRKDDRQQRKKSKVSQNYTIGLQSSPLQSFLMASSTAAALFSKKYS